MNLAEQIAHLEDQLSNIHATADKARWHVELANTYADLAEVQYPQENLSRAIASYKKALGFYSNETPLYARLQNSLGTAYQALAQIEHHQANLAHAIDAFEEAITFGNPLVETIDFMLALNNLGNACWQLAQYENRQRNLERAETAYLEARTFINVEDSPLAFATLHNNLGNVQQELAQLSDTIPHLNSAIQAYQIALEYLSAENGALAYAGVQNNLGNAYRELAHRVEDSTQIDTCLRHAITAYSAALKIYTPQTAPSNYLMTRANQGLTYAEQYDWDSALICWCEAADAAETLGAKQSAQQYRAWIEAAESALAEE